MKYFREAVSVARFATVSGPHLSDSRTATAPAVVRPRGAGTRRTSSSRRRISSGSRAGIRYKGSIFRAPRASPRRSAARAVLPCRASAATDSVSSFPRDRSMTCPASSQRRASSGGPVLRGAARAMTWLGFQSPWDKQRQTEGKGHHSDYRQHRRGAGQVSQSYVVVMQDPQQSSGESCPCVELAKCV